MRAADLILAQADIRTQDDRRPRASALAVAGNRIMAVGQVSEVMNTASPETRVINLGGRLVLPGFMDSHIHYSQWALGRRRLELAGAGSLKDLVSRVSQSAARTQAGAWILGQGWNEGEWPDHRQPTIEDLDRAAPDNPVLLWRCDLHMAVANSAALKAAGIDRNTPDPPEGIILKDQSGRPNGLLREAAIDLVRRVLPAVTDDELREAFCEGQSVLHGFGLTAIHDVPLMDDREGSAAGRRVWQNLVERGEISLRVWTALPGEQIDEAVSLGLRSGFGGPFLRLGCLKYFADGGMGARTAWLFEPYLDGGVGMPLLDMDQLAEDSLRADRHGLAVMIHAIGDRANHEVIGILERIKAERSVAGPALPHRIEHVQMLRAGEARRFKGLGAAVCLQPPNLIIDINMIDECLGERGARTYPFRELMDSGAEVIFSSDAPVCDHNPLVGIHSAVNRFREDGRPSGGWHPDQRVTVDEAVRAYTIGAAVVHGVKSEAGSITPGKYADIIVLDRNIYEIDPAGIHAAQVDLTVFDGKIVFNRG